jgi:flagellar protein FliO/FliZ
MDMSLVLRAIFALTIVLGLIALAAWVARRAPQLRMASLNPSANRIRRLAVLERIMLDPRRQVIILRDGVREHVILLGMSGEQILESRATEANFDTPALRLVDQGPAS